MSVASDLELLILLSPPEYWNYKHVLLLLGSVMLDVELRDLCLPGKHSTN